MSQSTRATPADAISLLEKMRPQGEPPNSRWRDAVYVLIADGEVAYVGYSANLADRLRAHRTRAASGGYSAHIAYTFPTKKEALSVESALIAALKPRRNRQVCA